VVIVFGSINLDLVFTVAQLPQAGQTLLAEDLSIEPGGKGANQAVAAARDGATVRMVGAVGRDAFANAALTGLRKASVDLSALARTAAPTGCAAISTDRHGQNQIMVAPGANLEARADQVDDAHLGPQALLLLQMETAVAETCALIRRARARGARVVLNLAPAQPIELEVLRLLDFLIVNEDEGTWLAERLRVAPGAASLQRAIGCGVIRTLGAQGAEVTTPTQQGWRQPAPPVEAIDSTAAGDCFAGVLAASLDAQRSLHEAVSRAVAAASLCCTRRGSQGSLPSAAEIDAVA
jgi:ribokinase